MALSKKEQRLAQICANINKSVKGAAVTYLGAASIAEFKRLSSQIPALDEALGGGWPFGRVVELYGSESTGKTTLCYHAIAQFQKEYPDEIAAWIDTEASIDKKYAAKVGVNVRELLFESPDTAELALSLMKAFIAEGVKLIIVDSVACLTPQAQRSKEVGERTVGEVARVLAEQMRIIGMDAAKAECLIMFTNQLRDKIGVIGWGEKTTTPGGRALKHANSIRLELKNIGVEKENGKPVCNRVKATTKKNKTHPPLREAEYSIVYGVGVDSLVDTFDAAVKCGVISKNGAWFGYGSNRIGCGKVAALDWFRKAGPDMLDKLKADVEAAKAAGTVVEQPKVKKPKMKGDEPADSLEQGEEEETPADDFNEPSASLAEDADSEVEVSSV